MKSYELIPFDMQGSRMKIAAAIVGSAVVAGGTSLAGSSAQAGAANNAANLQEQQFQQTQANQAPFIGAGQSALGTIQQDQASGTGFAAPFSLQNFMSNPGYQFQEQQGQNAINSSAAATGGALNGGTLKALDQYTTGLANSTYNSAYQNYLAGSNQQYNQLLGVAGLGESAATNTGAQGAAAANAAGNYGTQAGNAAAAGAVGAGNAATGAASNYAGYTTQNNILAQLSSQSGYAKPGVTPYQGYPEGYGTP